MTDKRSSFSGRAAPMPPTMNRSQPQLATAYAPGAMFTWEGGKGACMAVPVDATKIDFTTQQARLEQILLTMSEYCESWLARGLAITTQRAEPVHERQLLDDCFYNSVRSGTAGVDIAVARFEFMKPDRMGYLPGPLVYRCDQCEVVREYVSAAHQLADPLPTACRRYNGERDCRWRQLDVVFAHWSGEIEGLSPYRNMLDSSGDPMRITRCQCGVEEFRLIKQGQHFNRWRFQCTGCQATREVVQTDPFSLALLKPLMDQGETHQWSEINMLPVSYRASPVYYVQSARFIVYDTDTDIISILGPNRTEDLVDRVAALHGFGGGDPSLDRIREQLERAGQGGMFNLYQTLLSTDSATAQAMLDAWYADRVIERDALATPALRQQVDDRGNYARRYDPIRSTIEHQALRRRKLEPSGQAADLTIAQPDLSAEHSDPAQRAAYGERVRADLARAGIAEMRLVRDLDMVEFSFGFSRVSAGPVTVQKNLPMPVRLKGFPRLRDNRSPVYVIEQQNEALYVRLDPTVVAEFLHRNNVLPVSPPAPKSLGGELIEGYRDFGPFLRDFGVRDDASQVRARDVASTVYLLLHTLSHHVMHGIARFSGLDLGAMSEAIYPADLAFLVHRRGMTEDLGNISSMWRDYNAAFLDYLVSRRELRCGSGTLCDHRGGACPACVMVPETSCIAGNQLLSRAALVGGAAPLWDQDASTLEGYFAVVRDLQAVGTT